MVIAGLCPQPRLQRLLVEWAWCHSTSSRRRLRSRRRFPASVMAGHRTSGGHRSPGRPTGGGADSLLVAADVAKSLAVDPRGCPPVRRGTVRRAEAAAAPLSQLCRRLVKWPRIPVPAVDYGRASGWCPSLGTGCHRSCHPSDSAQLARGEALILSNP